MRFTKRLPLPHLNAPASAAICVLVLSCALPAAELHPKTVTAWEEYIAAVNAKANARLEEGAKFLWVEEDSGRLARVRRGEVLAVPVAGHGTRRIPGGVIHDWIGAVFIPNTTLPELFAVLRDYDRYKDIYLPATLESRLILREGNSDRFSAVLSRHVLFVTTTSYGEYESSYMLAGEGRWWSISHSTRLQDVADFGKPGERKLPPDDGSGFLWRAYSLSRYWERDGGVYMELEGIVLSRDIPLFWRWLVNPIIEDLSRATLLTSLRETRDAVLSRNGNGSSK